MRQQVAHVGELHLTELKRQQQARGQRAGQACQARIMRERIDQRTRLDQLRGGGHHLVVGRKQQAVVFEERAAGGLRDRDEFFGIGLERGGQRVGGGVGELRGARFDHHQHGVAAIRESLAHRVFEARPVLVGFDETADVRVDLEVMRHIDAAQDGEHDRGADDPQRVAHRIGDETDNR